MNASKESWREIFPCFFCELRIFFTNSFLAKDLEEMLMASALDRNKKAARAELLNIFAFFLVYKIDWSEICFVKEFVERDVVPFVTSDSFSSRHVPEVWRASPKFPGNGLFKRYHFLIVCNQMHITTRLSNCSVQCHLLR